MEIKLTSLWDKRCSTRKQSTGPFENQYSERPQSAPVQTVHSSANYPNSISPPKSQENGIPVEVGEPLQLLRTTSAQTGGCHLTRGGMYNGQCGHSDGQMESVYCLAVWTHRLLELIQNTKRRWFREIGAGAQVQGRWSTRADQSATSHCTTAIISRSGFWKLC